MLAGDRRDGTYLSRHLARAARIANDNPCNSQNGTEGGEADGWAGAVEDNVAFQFSLGPAKTAVVLTITEEVGAGNFTLGTLGREKALDWLVSGEPEDAQDVRG